jgi:putative transposase
MKRRRALRVLQQDEGWLPRILALTAEHPFWGDRRGWAYLHFIEPLKVNNKRLRRLMREPHLVVPPTRRLKAKRPAMHHQPKPIKPHEWWGIEMTTVVVEGLGWVAIVVIPDW